MVGLVAVAVSNAPRDKDAWDKAAVGAQCAGAGAALGGVGVAAYDIYNRK